jgi:hypothetical protein
MTRPFEPNRKLRIEDYEAPKDIRLVGGWLVWQPVVAGYHIVKPRQEMFDRFLDLADEADKDILRYANRWGVLKLCREHQHPVSDLREHPLVGDDGLPCSQVAEDESTDAWRKWSRVAGSILQISQILDDGNLGKPEQWINIYPRLSQLISLNDKDLRRNFLNNAKRQKEEMAFCVNRWLEMGDVRPVLIWDDPAKTDPLLQLTGSGLFGALALALLENVGGRYVIAACNGCRKFYNPEIRPKSGQYRYCPTCRKAGVPVARAKHRKALGLSKTRERG